MDSRKLSIDKLPLVPKMATGKAKKLAEKGLTAIGKRMVDAAIQLTRAKNAIASKQYINSFKFEVKPRSVSLINTTPYAVFVENGRGPSENGPPRAAIVFWLRRKFPGQFPAAEWTKVKRVAYAIAMKIKRKGTNPASHHKILEEVTKSVDVNAELARYMKGGK